MEILDAMTANRDKVVWAGRERRRHQDQRWQYPRSFGHHEQTRYESNSDTCSSAAKAISR
jgi:hypothetical protein